MRLLCQILPTKFEQQHIADQLVLRGRGHSVNVALKDQHIMDLYYKPRLSRNPDMPMALRVTEQQQSLRISATVSRQVRWPFPLGVPLAA